MIHTFAAIYIGSYEVSIKIFEISGKKKIRDIDYIRSRIELGRDAYSKGSIGYELVEALCDTLAEYKKIMDGYRVDSYEAYAAAALRNAENELFILDQIRIRTGLLVKVLSNSEHRFISYKSVALNERLEDVFPQQMLKYCVSRGHVLLTSTQLLCLYIEVCKNPICKEERITELLSCVGKYERYREIKDYLK